MIWGFPPLLGGTWEQASVSSLACWQFFAWAQVISSHEPPDSAEDSRAPLSRSLELSLCCSLISRTLFCKLWPCWPPQTPIWFLNSSRSLTSALVSLPVLLPETSIHTVTWGYHRPYLFYFPFPRVTLFHSDQISRSATSNSLRPHESQHARPTYSSPTPRIHSDSHPSSQWCHPAISSSVVPFSSCPQSLPAWVNSSHEVAKELEFQL